jgi:chemotaxis protein CheD
MQGANGQEVPTGEVRVGPAGATLVVSALGSCIAVVAFDLARKVGGIAHVMLPGQAAPAKAAVRHRYAVDAVNELLAQLSSLGSTPGDLTICLAGGANVLEREEDLICARNIASVTEVVSEKGLAVVARSLGGTRRRRIKLDVARGCVQCRVGDDGETVLWPEDRETVTNREPAR